MKGICKMCKTRKNKFVKNGSSTGSEFLNEAIGKLWDLDIEIHLAADQGENVINGFFNNLQKYSHVGLGTKYLQRIKNG